MSRLSLVPRLVETNDDLESMRVIRNTCVRFMTRSTREISREQQQSWWSTLDHTAWKCWVFEESMTNELIAYGTVCNEDKSWVSGGIIPKFRGRGLGHGLFEFLVKQAGKPCWLEVRLHNTPAVLTYIKLGFQVAGVSRIDFDNEPEDIVTMVLE